MPDQTRITEPRGAMLAGQIFGKLEVLNYSHVHKRKKMWTCVCACGNKTIVSTGQLRAGRTKSCGVSACSRGDRHGEIWSSFWNNKKYDASARNLEFSITIEEAWQKFLQQNRRCALSGQPIYFGARYTQDETTASMDRADNSIGYTKGNVQWVHKELNRMKGQLSMKEFKSICQLVAQT